MSSYPLRRPARFPLIRALILPASLLVPLAARAQDGGTVSGVVRDAVTNAPLPGATAMLRDPADSSAKPLGDISDPQGGFSIERAVIGRRYRLEVVHVGYERHVVENVVVTAGRPTLAIGDVLLRQAPVDLGGVEVTSERELVVVRADKTVYDVENNPAYTATNLSELLGQIPSVDVDQDGKVSLRGNDNVTIMMNDRPLTMPAEQRNKFLQSIPANMVKDIEIRTNPGAQFDAKYDGGIINIVTRRTMSDMFGGNANAGTDTRLGGTVGAGLYYNGDDLNGSIGGSGYLGPHTGSSRSLRLNYRDDNEWRDQGEGSSESTSGSLNGYGQLDYKFMARDLVSLSFNLNNWSADYTSNSNHTFYNVGGGVTGRYVDGTTPENMGGNVGGYNSASFLLRHSFTQDHKISLNLSYNAHNYGNSATYSSTYFRANGELDSARSAGRKTAHDQANRTLITTLDYENPVSADLTLSFGGKNEINSLDNNTSVSNLDRGTGEFILDSVQTNHYLPTNTIYALYGNISYKLSEAVSVQGGLRFEQANVAAKYASGRSIISRDYSNVFPSGSIAYTIDEQQSLTLSYRRSVALPDIEALNPVKVKWSDFYERSGNPDLVPEFTHSLELGYSTFWGMGNMVTLSPYYSITQGSIETSEQLINGVSLSTFENFRGTYSLGSELSVGMRPFPWLNFRVAASVFQKVNRGSATPGDIHSAAIGYNGNGSFSADLTEALTFSMNAFFNQPAQVGGSRQSSQSFMSFSLRQRLLDKKLNISLRLNDPFNLQKWENVYDSPEFHTEMVSRWSSRFVGLNVSYTFGTTPRLETHKQDKTDTKGGGSGGSGGGGGQ